MSLRIASVVPIPRVVRIGQMRWCLPERSIGLSNLALVRCAYAPGHRGNHSEVIGRKGVVVRERG